jgi:hypothetical protein
LRKKKAQGWGTQLLLMSEKNTGPSTSLRMKNWIVIAISKTICSEDEE